MAKFSYTAERADGEIYQGIADARDRFELYQIIRREGGKLVTFSDASVGNKMTLEYWNARLTRVSEQQKIMLTRNIGSMLSAGLTLTRAIGVIERQTDNPHMREIVVQIGSEIRRGSTLHVALEKFPKVFSKLLVAMVRAGEESGELASALKNAADQTERAHNLKKKIRSAMIYPVIVLVAVIGIGAIMMIFVVPTLMSTFQQMNATLPLPTQIIIGISNALTNHFFAVVLGLVVVIVLAIAAKKSESGKVSIDWVLLRMPMIKGIVREVNAARTARSLSSLVASGVDVLTALDITRETLQNRFFQKVMIEAQKAVSDGQQLSTIFLRHENLYPPLVGEMVAVGEETGQTAEMLKNLAVFYEDEVDRKTKDMSTIIEPFLMLFIGAAVGFFAVSIISPIYSITQHI